MTRPTIFFIIQMACLVPPLVVAVLTVAKTGNLRFPLWGWPLLVFAWVLITVGAWLDKH